jgi:hypothetical protein
MKTASRREQGNPLKINRQRYILAENLNNSETKLLAKSQRQVS